MDQLIVARSTVAKLVSDDRFLMDPEVYHRKLKTRPPYHISNDPRHSLVNCLQNLVKGNLIQIRKFRYSKKKPLILGL